MSMFVDAVYKGEEVAPADDDAPVDDEEVPDDEEVALPRPYVFLYDVKSCLSFCLSVLERPFLLSVPSTPKGLPFNKGTRLEEGTHTPPVNHYQTMTHPLCSVVLSVPPVVCCVERQLC